MARPGTGGSLGSASSPRPTHIAMPTSAFSPNGSNSPLATPTGAFGGATSPASPRHSFLGFIRTRSRAATMTNSQNPSSPSQERGNPLALATSRGGSSREGSVGPHAGREGGNSVTRSISTPMSGGLAGASIPTPIAESPTTAVPQPAPGAAASVTSPTPTDDKTYRIRLVPHLDAQRSLSFEPVVRELASIVVSPADGPGPAAQAASAALASGASSSTNAARPPAVLLKVGRFTDKATPAGEPAPPPVVGAGGGGEVNSGKVAFKSKVVSRSHAEIWCEPGGKFYIRDTKSSSGTFLNHIRLSSPNIESRPTLLQDGDILQLGVDYQGGVDALFRCVKMKIEVGREWQRGANSFNTNALKQLKALGGSPEVKTPSKSETSGKKSKVSVTDCCICLFSVTVCQSLFIAPCSHVFHYKCIRPLLQQHHPGFSCPLCRTFANLEEDVETEDAWEIASRRASVISRRASNHSLRIPSSSQAEAASPAGASQPSSGIALGAHGASASVEQLLAPGADVESSSTEEGVMLGSSDLARQTTAVASGEAQEELLHLDVPAPVMEEDDELDISGAGQQIGDHRGSVPIPIGRLAMNDQDEGRVAGAAFSEAATPMNEHFLSTLAIAPGIDQRLALAEEMGSAPNSGPGSNTVSAHGHEGDAERQEMMFT